MENITAAEFLKILKPVVGNTSTFELDIDEAVKLIGRKISVVSSNMIYSLGLIYGIDLSYAKNSFVEDGRWAVVVILNTSVGKYKVECIWPLNELAEGDRGIAILETDSASCLLTAKMRERTTVHLRISAA